MRGVALQGISLATTPLGSHLKTVAQANMDTNPWKVTSKPHPSGDTVTFGSGGGIDMDKKRFWDKVQDVQKKKIWENIVHDQVQVNPEKGISYPAPWVEQPTFAPRSPENEGGAGQGQGQPGGIARDPQPGQGNSGPAGQGKGNHGVESWIPPKEFMGWLKEMLQLPNLKPKVGGGIPEQVVRFDRQKTKPPGPPLLPQTFKRALKRSMGETIGSGKQEYEPASDLTLRECDLVRRDYRLYEKPKSQTAVFFIRDISGSMGDDERTSSRTHAWMMEMLLREMAAQERAGQANSDSYTTQDFWDNEHFKIKFLVHDEDAVFVERNPFYELSSGGGTNIAPAYTLIRETIEKEFPGSDWNVYVMHFTDGDNYSSTNDEALQEIYKMLHLGVNRFSLIDVGKSRDGEFTRVLSGKVGQNHPYVSVSRVKNSQNLNEYIKSIKTILAPVTEEVKA